MKKMKLIEIPYKQPRHDASALSQVHLPRKEVRMILYRWAVHHFVSYSHITIMNYKEMYLKTTDWDAHLSPPLVLG